MTFRLLRTALFAACAAAPLALLPAAPAAAQALIRPAQDITLSIGSGQLVSLPGNMADVFVSNDAVADVQVKSQRQLYVFGKGGGLTTVYASNAKGDVVWSANVRVGSNLDSVDSMLRLAMPDAKIGVSTMGSNTFLLTGTVKSPEDGAEAERLVQAYVGKDANVISRVRTATPLQVNLQVRFAEVSRSLVKQLNSNLSTLDGTGGFKFGIGQGRPTGPFNAERFSALGMGQTVTTTIRDPATGQIVTTIPGTAVSRVEGLTSIAGLGKLFGLNILGTLDAGENIGLVTTLAQPNLTALSGETADFLAGGEYPIPISQGLGATSVEFKKYGVSLAYTPTVLSNGRISLRVRPEVSELTTQGSVVLNGYSIPGITVRRTETTVELGSGQSFMIAGLLSNNSQNTIQKLPGAGDLPILGSLFRSTSYRRGETELVIVVTPYLVNPVDGNQIALPTDGFNAPNDLQRILGNMETDGSVGSKADRSRPTAAPVSTGPDLGAASSLPAAEGKKGKSGKRSAAADAAPGFATKF
ncbi:pilus assembly protein CpaC [Novosphingobium chloroacetimidivorans]|uniref:Pilus assembly protein CpaC n=1 Tax=Novosphingobium chloroacetimidivorans TaxID=1428314 RepID=A0A7W7NYH9_9SPHN|nr:type II and III secretion system protein family protein [Novosphingobium chloroacetimidivorans]MBB4860240.1 pilus assembly protein CpaC [Novosphingobium chloroacetimidivorans]